MINPCHLVKGYSAEPVIVGHPGRNEILGGVEGFPIRKDKKRILGTHGFLPFMVGFGLKAIKIAGLTPM